MLPRLGARCCVPQVHARRSLALPRPHTRPLTAAAAAAASSSDTYTPTRTFVKAGVFIPGLGMLGTWGCAKVLALQGLIFSSGFVTTGGVAAAAICLAPVGLLRGATDAAEEVLNHEQPVGKTVRAALEPVVAQQAGGGATDTDGLARALQRLALEDGKGSLASEFVQAKGVSGTVLRLCLGVVLPRTDIVVEHAVRELRASSAFGKAGDEGDVQLQLDIAAGAANGLAQSFVSDWRDRATVAGGLVFALALAAILAIDRAAGKAHRKVEEGKAKAAALNAKRMEAQEALLAKEKEMSAKAEAAARRAWGEIRAKAFGGGDKVAATKEDGKRTVAEEEGGT